MDIQLYDSKLKSLIRLCKATGNYKKLAVVGLILISNKVDEISTKLGVRTRKKNDHEHLFKYIEFINQIFYESLQITIVPEDIIESLKTIELLFIKLRGDLPYDHIKELYEIYYEIRKIDVPNIYKSFEASDMLEYSDLNLFSYLTNKGKKKSNHQNRVKSLLFQQIAQKEKVLRKSLDNSFNKDSFEQALHLNRLKSSLRSKSKGRISATGKLASNIYYQISQQISLKYLLLGGIIVFILLDAVVIYESIMFPHLLSVLSIYLVTFLGVALLLFLIYRKLFKRGEN
ncbi:MAG: hypothetical protein ACFE8M_02825 [Candidatus Hermodarchaeota archaeon]